MNWREYCEQSTLKSMCGDFRKVDKKSRRVGEDKTPPKSNVVQSREAEMHKEVWEAILVFGQAIEEKLNKASSGSKKDVELPKLSTLCSFLNNAYFVSPTPREIFLFSDVPIAIDACLSNIATHVDLARNLQAKLMDLLDEANDNGVDLDALQKLLDEATRTLAVELDDGKILYEQVLLGLDWQKRLDSMVSENDHCLSSMEELAEEGRSFAFRSKSLVILEGRILKAHRLRDKIVRWKKVSLLCVGFH